MQTMPCSEHVTIHRQARILERREAENDIRGPLYTFSARWLLRGGLRAASVGRPGRPLRHMVPSGSWLHGRSIWASRRRFANSPWSGPPHLRWTNCLRITEHWEKVIVGPRSSSQRPLSWQLSVGQDAPRSCARYSTELLRSASGPGPWGTTNDGAVRQGACRAPT